MSAGERVKVVDVREERGIDRVRGRIEEPLSGWINLVALSGGSPWASKSFDIRDFQPPPTHKQLTIEQSHEWCKLVYPFYEKMLLTSENDRKVLHVTDDDVQKLKGFYQECCDHFFEAFKRKWSEGLAKTKQARESSDIEIILASSAELSYLVGEPVLRAAIWAVQAIGGSNIAGDADDHFHKILMKEEEMTWEVKGWRLAWKGKLEGAINAALKPRKSIKFLSIKGGPETQWERNYLLKELPKTHGEQPIRTELFEDLDDLMRWLLADA